VRSLNTTKIEIPIYQNLQDNEEYIRNLYKNCDDIKIRNFQFGRNYKQEALVVLCDFLVQEEKSNLLHTIIKDMHFEAHSPFSYYRQIKNFFENKGIASRPVMLSLTMYKNEIELGESGSVLQSAVTFFFGFLPLLLVVIIAKVKNRNRKQMD
jgi:hypothetical protein